jgi:peptidoglycan/xylan/chitin deacetylase (PgdA/CDA1 family)
MKKKLLLLLLILLILFVAKINLCLVGNETVEAKTEINKSLYQIETIFNHKLITKGTTKEKLVALTIDDGPDPRFTPEVLDIMKRYHVPATFFVVGQSCKKYPDLIKRELAEGNEIENHTYTHPDLSKDNALRTEEEILKDQEVILHLTNRMPVYFRPPKRLFTNETVDIAEANGYRVVLWSICVEHQACKTVSDMANRVIKAAKPGIIILTHDGRLDRSRSVEALPMIIEGYQKKGYRFVRLDELLKNQSSK